MEVDAKDSREDLARTIESIDWSEMTPRLLTFAAFRLARYGRFSARFGKTPADYVQEAVELLLTGRRHIPRQGDISIFSFLSGIISSLVSHDAERPKNVSFTQLDFAEDDELLGEQEPLDDTDIEREVIAREEAERFIESLDHDLQEYVRLRATGYYSTAEELARALNKPVATIRSLDRRLRRMRAKR